MAGTARPRPAANLPRPRPGALEAPPRPRHPGERPSRTPKWVKNDRGEWVKAADLEEELGVVRDTGEPVIVQKVRAQFARWAAVSLGCFALNLATGFDTPWFLFPSAGMGIGLVERERNGHRASSAVAMATGFRGCLGYSVAVVRCHGARTGQVPMTVQKDLT